MRIYLFLFLLVFTAASMASGRSAHAADTRDCGNYDDQLAIAACTKYIDGTQGAGPARAMAFYNRGLIYWRMATLDPTIGNYGRQADIDQAISDYGQAIALRPDYPEAFNKRGLAFDATGDFEQAINDYDQAIVLKPDYAEAFSNRCLASAEALEVEQSIQDCNRAIELDPSNARAFYNRGMAYQDKSDLAQRHQLTSEPSKTSSLDNDDPQINENLERAISDYDQAIKLRPEYAEAFDSRGVAYYREKNYARAIDDFKQACVKKPGFTKAKSNLAAARKALEASSSGVR